MHQNILNMKDLKKILAFSAFGILFGINAKAQTVQLPQAIQCCTLTDGDSDGIPDNMDKCPTVAGVAALQGCPVPTGFSTKGYFWACDHENTAIVDITLPDGSIWMDRDMGALRAATDVMDMFSAGCLYQYGRKPDGHQRTEYYQPPNWGNGYPTAAGVLSMETFGTYAQRINGYMVMPNPGQVPLGNNNYNDYYNASGNSLGGGSPLGTYTQKNNSTATSQLIMFNPTDDDSAPYGTRKNTGGGDPSVWYSNIATYPWNDIAYKLWGGIYSSTISISMSGAATNLGQAWGLELNPVCPAGYHVPTANEWYSAINSVYNATPAGQNWGTSAFKLHQIFGGWGTLTGWWTSTPASNAMYPSTTQYFGVAMNPQTTKNVMAGISVDNVRHIGPGLVENSKVQVAGSLWVRCIKN